MSGFYDYSVPRPQGEEASMKRLEPPVKMGKAAECVEGLP